MKRKNLITALAIVMLGTFVSVLAQKNISNLPGLKWIVNSAMATEKVSVSTIAAESIIHDPEHPTSGTFNNTLKNPNLSQHQDGDTVVVMNAEGELPGTLTLKLHRDADGTTVTDGEWAFNVSYTEIRHIENPEDGGEDHGEFLVQRGTLKGTITGGQVTLNEDGSVSGFNSVQLAVNGGSLTFHDVNSGSGNGQVSNLQNTETSTGTLTLSF